MSRTERVVCVPDVACFERADTAADLLDMLDSLETLGAPGALDGAPIEIRCLLPDSLWDDVDRGRLERLIALQRHAARIEYRQESGPVTAADPDVPPGMRAVLPLALGGRAAQLLLLLWADAQPVEVELTYDNPERGPDQPRRLIVRVSTRPLASLAATRWAPILRRWAVRRIAPELRLMLLHGQGGRGGSPAGLLARLRHTARAHYPFREVRTQVLPARATSARIPRGSEWIIVTTRNVGHDHTGADERIRVARGVTWSAVQHAIERELGRRATERLRSPA